MVSEEVLKKLLTINIPTYNRSTYLQKLFESIESDLIELGEIVEINILDNCSTDNTSAVIKNIQSRHECIKYICNPENIGAIANIYKAHRLGSGQYLWVMGDDDYLAHGAFRRIITALQERPSALLLSYARVTPHGSPINDISIGEFDLRLDNSSGNSFSLVPLLDPLIGFISANIVDRVFVDEITHEEFIELDRIGELGHSMIMYRAIASPRTTIYLSGQPLIQTADNGYLKHETWLHVCLQYCNNMPIYLQSIGYSPLLTQRYFKKRLFKECARRVLSEKYRKKTPWLVVRSPAVKECLGYKIAILFFLCMLPGRFVRIIYDFIKLKRI